MRNRRLAKRVRAMGAPGGDGSDSFQITITDPAEGFTVPSGMPINFSGQAAIIPPSSPDQAGTVLHSMPGSGWTEIGPGRWQNAAGDVEDRTLYKVTAQEWWGLSQGTNPDTACFLFSAISEQPVSPDQDFWICPTGAFLPGQAGFQAPDISALIEWNSDLDGKFGEGANTSAVLRAGTHHVTAQVSLNGSTQSSPPLTVTVEAPPVQQQPQTPAQTQNPPSRQIPSPAQNQPTAAAPQQQSGSSWLWLLLLLLLLSMKEDDE